MIPIPWYVRLGVDCSLVLVPCLLWQSMIL